MSFEKKDICKPPNKTPVNPKILRQSLKQILRKKDICKMSEHNTDKSNDVETKFEPKYKRSKKVEVSERNTDLRKIIRLSVRTIV